jgi:hypothetical protein
LADIQQAETDYRRDEAEAQQAALMNWLRTGENPPAGMDDVTDAERLAMYQQTPEYQAYALSMLTWDAQQKAEAARIERVDNKLAAMDAEDEADWEAMQAAEASCQDDQQQQEFSTFLKDERDIIAAPVSQEKTVVQSIWDGLVSFYSGVTASTTVTSGKGNGLAAPAKLDDDPWYKKVAEACMNFGETAITAISSFFTGMTSGSGVTNPFEPTNGPIILPTVTPWATLFPPPTKTPAPTSTASPIIFPTPTSLDLADPVMSGTFPGLGKTYSGDDMKNLCEYLAGIDYLDINKNVPAPWKAPGSKFGPTECLAWYTFKETKAVYPLDLPSQYYYDPNKSNGIDGTKIWGLEDINDLKDTGFYYLTKAATKKLWSLNSQYSNGYPDLTPMSLYNFIATRESAMRDFNLMSAGRLEEYYLTTGEGTSYYPVAQYITQIMLNPPDETWKSGWWDWGNIYVFNNPTTYDAILASPTLPEDQATKNKISKLFCSYLPENPTPEQKAKTFCIFTGDQLNYWKEFDKSIGAK